MPERFQRYPLPAGENRRLIQLSRAVSDGAGIDWEAEFVRSPGLAPALGRLRQLEALGRLHHSLGAHDLASEGVGEIGLRESLDQSRFRFGPLAVLELVGRGTFGEVYRALDLRLDREVALKLRRIDGPGEPAARRFLDEARSLARVRHPNVVVVHGAEVDGKKLGFWTDFVRGQTLAAYLAERGPLSAEEAARIGIDLCRALGAVHAAGFVHGDVKAANAMRDESGRVLLMDFGAVSRLSALALGHRGPERVVGSPLTMAPEVETGEAVPASDLFSLGVLLYQLVTGEYPFIAPDAAALRRMKARGERRPLGALRPELPVAFVTVVERALQPDPALRYPNAAEMEGALLALLESPGRRHSLPAEADAFVGRESELDEVAERLRSGARVVTLLGAAGMGKTRLAVRAGWQTLDAWPGGVWFCDLAGATGRDGIAAVVAGALGVPVGRGGALDQLGHAIAGRGRCLVILDNFEHLTAHAEETVGSWLARAGEAQFLLTSRERLRLRGEAVQEVAPLPVESGMELFLERAGRQRPRFALQADEEVVVEEIVQLADGMPLAIELAAARVRILTPRELAARMRQRFQVLGGEGAGRHATLHAAIDGSWELLRPWEQAALAQCSVFEDGFTLAAAEAVVDLSAHPAAPWVIDVVQALVDKSLVRSWMPEGAGGVRHSELRFGMYASIAAYAREKLAALPAKLAAEVRHGAWYARSGTEEAIAALAQHGGVERRRALELEVGNVVAACRRALARGELEIAVRAYRAAGLAIDLRGPFQLAVELGREVLAAPLSDRDRATALMTMAHAEASSGQNEEARAHYESALALYERAGDGRGEAAARNHLGLVHTHLGQTTEARAQFEAALVLNQETGNRHALGLVLTNLAILELEAGGMEAAREHFETALEIHRAVGDRRREGAVLGLLGNLHLEQGRMEEARAHYEQALAVHVEVHDRRYEGIVRTNLGILCHQVGRLEEAEEHHAAALVIHRELGNRRAKGIALVNLSALDLERGRLQESRAQAESALTILREVGDRRWEGIVLSNLAIWHAQQGDLAAAATCFADGERLLRALDSRMDLGKLLCHRAELERRMGDLDAARTTLAESERLAALIGAGPNSEFGQFLVRLREMLEADRSQSI
jgi:predicted ATPase/Tfp pilus assembly protein PilF